MVERLCLEPKSSLAEYESLLLTIVFYSHPTWWMNSVDAEQLFQRLSEQLLAHRNRDGHWVGQLSDSALATATTISAFSFYLESGVPKSRLWRDLESKIELGVRWLMSCQNQDGGWGGTDKSKSDVPTSMVVEAAIAATGRTDEFSSQITHCQEYLSSQGGISQLRSQYKNDELFADLILANCALTGLVPWSEVAVLPFELACLPHWLYSLRGLRSVSFRIPALVGMGQAKFTVDPPTNPFMRVVRRLSVGRSLKLLRRMQSATGSFLDSTSLTGLVQWG